MVGDGGGFLQLPCFGTRKPEPEPDRDPVLLISGIGGSIINSKNKKLFGLQTRVWVRIFLSDLLFREKLISVYNPDTGYTECVDDNIEIVVPDKDDGLYAIDILDPSTVVKCLHVDDVYHFHDMIDMLVGCGYKKGTTLFGYGYDFRQSNRIGKAMDGLKAKLETASKASGGRKVNLISHSMGGLLISCFMSLHNDVFSKYVNKWISIACPFQGAPGSVNDCLLTGLQFVEGFESQFFVSRWTFHQLLVECPSIYEMLTNVAFKWHAQPQIQVWQKSSVDGETSVGLKSYGPTDSIALCAEALRNNEIKFHGKTVALPFNFDILKYATGTRQVIDNARLPDGISFYNIYGTLLDTPFDVCYGSESSPIEDLSEICNTLTVERPNEFIHNLNVEVNIVSDTLPFSLINQITILECDNIEPQYSYVDGDGTVPSESAKADGFKATERVAVAASHRGLLKDKTVFQLIQKWLGVDQKINKHLTTSKVVDTSL